LPKLTPYEQEVLGKLDEGCRSSEIAEGTNVSIKTAQRAIQSLHRKLGANTLYQLGAKAQELGLARRIQN
jgi:DNA-binding NarL/FixJ family response regulator